MKGSMAAEELHEQVPPNWYYQSIRVDPFRRYWHKRKFEEVSRLIEPSGGKILDIGCADGMFSKVIFDKARADERAWRDTHIQTYRNNYLAKLCKKVGFYLEENKKFVLGMLHLVKVRKI